MLIRVVRTVCGALVLLVGLPLLLAGGTLWLAMQHRDDAGGYTASLTGISSDGYAVVASDVDALLRQQVPFARAGQTTLRLSARTDSGPAFVGLGRAPDVASYLAGVPYTQLNEVRLARGPLPVVTEPVDGDAAPASPAAQSFWLASSDASGAVEWEPSDLRGQRLALVVMDREPATPVTVQLTAQLRPAWLEPTAWGLLALGTVLLLVAVAAIAWPVRGREIVYVVPPAQVPEIAARLGLPYQEEPAGTGHQAGAVATGVASGTAVAPGQRTPEPVAEPEPAGEPDAVGEADPGGETQAVGEAEAAAEGQAAAEAQVVDEPGPAAGPGALAATLTWPPVAGARETATPTRAAVGDTGPSHAGE